MRKLVKKIPELKLRYWKLSWATHRRVCSQPDSLVKSDELYIEDLSCGLKKGMSQADYGASLFFLSPWSPCIALKTSCLLKS